MKFSLIKACFLIKIIIFILINSISNLIAADFSTPEDNYKEQYNLGIYALVDTSKIELNLKRYQDVAKEYSKPGATIYCVVKNGPADLAGLGLFDRIVGIDDHPNFSFLFKNNKPLKIKYIKNEKLYEKVIKPKKVSDLNFKSDLECTKEFARYECSKYFHSKILKEKKLEWVRIYECLKEKGSKIIPFEKNYKNAWLMLDSFDFAFGYYIWDNQDKEKLKYYLSKSKEIINELEDYLKKDNPGKIDKEVASKKITNLITNISNFNTYVADDRLKNSFKIDNDKFGINKIKNKIIQINNFNDENNLAYLKTNFLVLKNSSEDDFIKIYWKKAVENIDWSSKSNFQHVAIYIDYLNSFKPEEALLGISLLDDLEKKLITFKNNPDAIMALRKIYSETWSQASAYYYTTMNSKALKVLKSLIKKFEKNYSNYETLSDKDKKYILKKDSLFLTSGYSAISNISSQFKDTDRAIKYADLRINIYNTSSKYGEEDKLYVYFDKFSYLALAGYTKDALNAYYDYKNSISKVYKTRNGLINLSITIPVSVMYLYQLGLYEEAQELVDFANLNLTFDSKSKNEWYDQTSIDVYRLYEALLLKKKFQYQKAINILEKVYKKCVVNSFDITVVHSCSAFAHLLELYHKTGKTNKFETIYQEKMGTAIANENPKKIYKYATTYMPDQITGLFREFLDYYKKNQNQKNYQDLASKSLKLTKNILSKENFLKKNQHLLSYLDVYEGLAQLGVYLAENNHPNGEKILKELNSKIINAYTIETFNSPISTNTKAKNIITSYLIAASVSSDDTFKKESYNLYQILRNSLTSKDIKKAIVRKSLANSKKYELVKKYQDYELLLSSYYKKDDFSLSNKKNTSQENVFEKTNKDNKIKPEFISDELKKLSKEINKNFPEYNNLTKPQPVKLNDIQQKILKEEAIIDYYFDDSNVYVFVITKDNFIIKKNKFLIEDQIKLQKNVRNSLTVNSSGKLNPYDVQSSYLIYKTAFKFVENILMNKKNIYVVPDGLLQNIPLNILATSNQEKCNDCSKVKWLMHQYNFTYLPSVDFISYKNKKDKTPKKLAKQYLGIGDPDLDSSNNDINISRVEIAKFLNRGSSSFVANTNEIKKIYDKVEGSSEEIKTVSNYFDPKNVSVLLNKDASEKNLKNQNLKIYKIIHFATHGEISGALKGYNEPFLVLTPPEKGTNENDGLLTMTEIMQLEIDSDLVILSACNTASGDQKNSEGFSGLARAFLFSGSKSVMVSNWYVETFSAKELIINFMSGFVKNNESSSYSLKKTMINFINSNSKKSHPFYWGPFVIVGNNSKKI